METIRPLRGIYRDILQEPDRGVIYDSCWRSNTIVNRCRILLAGFMSGDQSSGIRHLAVGSGSEIWDDQGVPETDPTVTKLVQQAPDDPIDAGDLDFTYLGDSDNPVSEPTTRLQVSATLNPGYPAPLDGSFPYPLREFGLFGQFAMNGELQVYMINTIRHPVIHKGPTATLIGSCGSTFELRETKMGNFSRDTFRLHFEKMKHYVSVRLQQGVPVVDADVNEMQDVRKYELRAFVKWFVGNGVPVGDDGFHIFSVDRDNDFDIAPGRCLVDGWDVVHDVGDSIFDGNLPSYKNQPLFDNPELAAKWGVAELPSLAPPPPETFTRRDTIYLDVWEREVDADEDEELIDPRIGIETCVRLRREWVVRVAEDTEPEELSEREEIPLPGSADVTVEHVYYPLALVTRQSDESRLQAIEDLRQTGLTVVDLKNELTALKVDLDDTKARLDALKDDKDNKDSKDSGKETKDTKDSKDGKDGKDTKDTKDTKDGKDGKDTKDTKDTKDGKDGKDTKDGKDGKDIKEKDNKELAAKEVDVPFVPFPTPVIASIWEYKRVDNDQKEQGRAFIRPSERPPVGERVLQDDC